MIKYKDFLGDDADWQLNCFLWTNSKIDAMNVETIDNGLRLRLWYKKKDDEYYDANGDRLPPACKDNPLSYNGSVVVTMSYTKNGEEGFVGTGFYDYDIKKWVLMRAGNDGIYREYIICNEKSGIKVLNYRIKT